jgi:ankyrin repeat protein
VFNFFFKLNDGRNLLMAMCEDSEEDSIAKILLQIINLKKNFTYSKKFPLEQLINKKDNDGNNILHYLWIDDIQCISELINLSYFDTSLFMAPNNKGMLPFTRFIYFNLYQNDNIFMYDFFYDYICLEHVDPDKNTYLHLIIEYMYSYAWGKVHGYRKLKKYLLCTLSKLSKKINVNSKNKNGDTPLHLLCSYRVKIILENRIFFKKQLLELICEMINVILHVKNVDPRILNNQNKSPFDLAWEKKNYKIAKYLISHPKYKESLFYCN